MLYLRYISVLIMAVLASFFLFAQAEAGKGGKIPKPTAVHNGPWAAATGEVITFSGAGSSSPNGPIAEYCWDFDDYTGLHCTSNETMTYSYGYVGIYNVTLRVMDTSYQYGSATDTATISYAPPGSQADLTVTAISGPRSGRRGDYYPISVTVENLGPVTATGTSWLAIYLSEDNVITTDDIKRMTIYVTDLGPGQSRTYDTEILLMGVIPLGDYYYGAIADELNIIDESDESNNTLSSEDTMTIRPQK